MDAAYGSAYIRFKNSKIVNTLEQCTDGPIITVDIDREGEVVGVEALFCEEFQIRNILKKAKVDVPSIDFSRAVLRGASKKAEVEGVRVF